MAKRVQDQQKELQDMEEKHDAEKKKWGEEKLDLVRRYQALQRKVSLMNGNDQELQQESNDTLTTLETILLGTINKISQIKEDRTLCVI